MFHISNLGSFGEHLHRYADLKGYLPESPEEMLKMDYELDGEADVDPETGEWDEDLREEFFAEASEAIAKAQEALSKWQAENS